MGYSLFPAMVLSAPVQERSKGRGSGTGDVLGDVLMLTLIGFADPGHFFSKEEEFLHIKARA